MWTRTALILVAVAACKSADAPAPPLALDAAVAPPPTPVAVPCVCPEPAPAPPVKAADDELTLTPATFPDLPDWTADQHAEAIPAFLASCRQLAKLDDDAKVGVEGQGGRARDWRRACKAAAKLPDGDDAAARAFFEAEFTPYAAAGKDGPDGKFTAYAVQELHGSRTRQGKYQTPIYARPRDLVSVALGDFIDDGKGRRIWGQVKDGELVKYLTRKEIRQGALDGKGLELLWVDDRVDALWAEIEGSGKVLLEDGTTVWIEVDGKNGRGYKAPGKLLREMGELQKGTMQEIRAWFAANPARFDEIADQNASVVFFAISDRVGGIGSQGVVLTPRRSIAIDRAFVAHSTPIWVDTRAEQQPWRHLLIAQDTGGGILGAVRGDLYLGDDLAATDLAGRMSAPGRWWLLLPRGVKVH